MSRRVRTMFQKIPGAECPADSYAKQPSNEGPSNLVPVKELEKPQSSRPLDLLSDVTQENFYPIVPRETSSLLNENTVGTELFGSYFCNRLCNAPLDTFKVPQSTSKYIQESSIEINEVQKEEKSKIQSSSNEKHSDLMTSNCVSTNGCDGLQRASDGCEISATDGYLITADDIVNAEFEFIYDSETDINISDQICDVENVAGPAGDNSSTLIPQYSELNSENVDDAVTGGHTTEEEFTNAEFMCDDPGSSETTTASPDTKVKKRRYVHKKWFCPYCKTVVTHFARHVQCKHREEEEIKKLDRLAGLESKEKKKQITAALNIIRNRGALMFNEKQSRGGEIIVKKKPSSNKPYKATVLTHATCKFCLTTLLRQNLYLHVKNCPERKNKLTEEDKEISPRGRVLKTSYHLQYNDHEQNVSDSFWTEVLMKMRNDMITMIAKSDPLIFKFGKRLYKNHREPQHRKYVSTRMRDLARVFLHMEQENNEINTFEDCIQPYNFDILIKAIQTLGGFDEKSGTLEVISVAHRFCSSLKSCADILLTESIKSPDITEEARRSIRSKMERFDHLMRTEWRFEIGTNAEKSRKRNHAKKIDICPSDDDIALVSHELEKLYEPLITSLNNNPSAYNFQALCKVVIADIIILCRRRPGEVVRATLEQYYQLTSEEDSLSQFRSLLSAEEQKAYDELPVFHVPGKNNKKVPILITKNMKKGIEALLQHRKTLNMPCDGSALLFPRPDKNNETYDGSMIISDISKKFDLKKPAHFTPTGLRHHIATTAQLFQSDGNFTENLATFMGHTLQVHKGNYRLPLSIIEKAKVGSRLLQITKKTYGSTPLSSPVINKITTCDEEVMPVVLHQEEGDYTPQLTVDRKEIENSEHFKQSRRATSSAVDKENVTCEGQIMALDVIQETNNDPDYTPEFYSEDEESENRENMKKRRRTKVIPWDEDEKKCIFKEFGDILKKGVNPKREDIRKLYAAEPMLKKRPITSVYTFINNVIKKKLKNT